MHMHIMQASAEAKVFSFQPQTARLWIMNTFSQRAVRFTGVSH